MPMPQNLIFVRHGESEGNVANHLSKRGDDTLFTPEFKSRHTSLWRLTDKGRGQAQIAGAWIKENIGSQFAKYYTSEYIRTMETAALLGLPHAEWFCEFYLRERDWGDLETTTAQERETLFARALKKRETQPFLWTPPGGESMASLCLRIDRFLDTLHRECDDKNVIVVCHGEVMWAFRVRLERMSQEEYLLLDRSKDPKDRINNCQIIQYSRINPRSGMSHSYLNWMRSVCPSDTTRSRNEWQEVIRKQYSNEELLERVSHVQPFVKTL